MLEHLRMRNTLLWIDAICINQKDDDEKAIRIPVMRRVHAQSAFVLVAASARDHAHFLSCLRTSHRLEAADC